MAEEPVKPAVPMSSLVESCIDPGEVTRFLEGPAAELAENSKKYYLKSLAKLKRSLDDAGRTHATYRELTADDIRVFLDSIQGLKARDHYRGSVQRFLEWLAEEGRGPDREAIKALERPKRKRFRGLKVRQKPLPGVFSPEDLKAIWQSATSLRDRALLVGLYASGARIGEWLAMNVEHVRFKAFRVKRQDGSEELVEKVRYTLPESKTRSRTLPWMRKSVHEMKAWLAARRAKGELRPSDPLWVSRRLDEEGRPRRLSYQAVNLIWHRQIMPRFEEITGRPLRGTVHWLRHTRLTELASSMTGQELCAFAGWTQASQMASVYINASGVSGQNGMSRAEGEIPATANAVESFDTQQCPNCGFEESIAARFCSQCGTPLGEKLAKKVESAIDTVLAEIERLRGEVEALKRAR